MDKRLLDILCCPVSKVPVKPLSRGQLDVLNAAIAAGDIRTTAGEPIRTVLSAGLITTDAKVIYRVEDDIPVMLADEAIGTTQLHGFPA
ncbi:MAG TPA: Trm112 family protein [Rudaea sp.]